MKLIFFMESYYCGGVDTFVTDLINNWQDNSDELVLICNNKHAGIDNISKKITRPCKVIRHKIATFQQFFNKNRNLTLKDRFLRHLFKILSPVSRYLSLIYNVFAFKRLLLYSNYDRLLIINGGYPGGDSCRAAGICWGLLNRQKPKSVHSFHGVVVRPGWHIALQEYLVDILVSKSTGIFVTVSRAAARLMNKRRVIQGNNKVTFIHSGIDKTYEIKANPCINIRKELGIEASGRLCLMIGNYNYNPNYDKGHYFLFEVFSRVIASVPGAYLMICGHGSGKDIDRTNNLARRFGINNKVYLSEFRADITDILAGSDLLLISAQAFESFGLVAIEAMAQKVPVVATNVGGLPEIIKDGEGGYSFNRDDVGAYSNCVIKLLIDDKLRKEQGAKGFERYRKFFTADKMAKRYTDMMHNA